MWTTLKDIERYKIDQYDTATWEKLLNYLNKTTADNESLSLMTIHKTMGINEAIWCLRTQDYRNYCLFLADIAESVLSVFEAEYPENKQPRQAIKAIRDWYNGDITKKQLKVCAYWAYTAAHTAHIDAISAINDEAIHSDNSFHATYDAYATAQVVYTNTCTTVFDNKASYAASTAFTAANIINNCTSTTATATATANNANASYNYGIREANWKKIDRLFIKHFGEDKNENYIKRNRKL